MFWGADGIRDLLAGLQASNQRENDPSADQYCRDPDAYLFLGL